MSLSVSPSIESMDTQTSIKAEPVPHTIFLCFHCATPGSPDEWGSEAEEMVTMSWTCIDSASNQVVSSKHVPIRTTVNEFCLDTYVKYGFSEDKALAAKPLADILRELHQSIISELLPECASNRSGNVGDTDRQIEVIPVTAGPGAIRQALHAETTGKGMDVPDYFYGYIDILEEYNLQFDCKLTSVLELAKMLNYNLSELDGSGLNESFVISVAVSKLLTEKNLRTAPFCKKQLISKRLQTVPCTKEEMVCEDTVIKVRGLPWQSSDQDVAQFFRGLNIARGGVALCLNPQGRRNGEALVRFCSPEHRDMALMRHKRHMGNRYIEVYKSSAEDFLKIAAEPNNEAIGFLSHGDNVIIKMRGLPFTATAEDVTEFFGIDLPIVGDKEGILFVKYPDGRSTGDAFVQFSSEELAKEALKLHKTNIRDRYIELFRSTAAEVVQVMKRFSNPPLLPNGPPNMNGAVPNMPSPASLGTLGMNPNLAALQNLLPLLMPPSSKSCLLLRNLPLSVKVEDIITFLGEHAEWIRPAGIHMVLNQQGRPSGDCFIQMHSDLKAAAASLSCNGKSLADLKVQVSQCSPEEMNSLFIEGASSSCPTQTHPFSLTSLLLGDLASAVSGCGGGAAVTSSSSSCSVFPDAVSSNCSSLIVPSVHQFHSLFSTPPSSPPQNVAAALSLGAVSPPSLTAPPLLAFPNLFHNLFPAGNVHQLNATNAFLTGNLKPHPGVHHQLHTHQQHLFSAAQNPAAMFVPSSVAAAHTTTPTYHQLTPPVSPHTSLYGQPNFTAVKMKGLPSDATVQDVMNFFSDYIIPEHAIQPVINQNGKPTGECSVMFWSPEIAKQVVAEKNNSQIKNHVIELAVI